MNKSIFPIATEDAVIDFLSRNQIDADETLVSDVIAKKVKFIDGEIMHTAEIPNTGISGAKVELLTVNNSQRYGFSDFDKKKLNANVLHVFDGIEFGYAEAATGQGANVRFGNLASQIPADLAACILRIEQKGRVVIEQNVSSLLVHDVQVAEAGSGTAYAYGFVQNASDGVKPLRKFGYLVGNRDTDIFLVTPDGETVQPSATLGHIRIALPGLKTLTSL